MKKSHSARFITIGTAILLCAAVIIPGCAKKEGPPLAAVIVFFAGDVTIEPAKGDPRNASLGERLFEGDALRTGERAHATIQIGDRGITRVERASRIEITKLFSAGEGELFLEKGELSAKIARLKKSEKFAVKTPTAIAAVRGTEFSARYRDGSGTVAVRSGKVAVSPRVEGKEPAGRETLVVEGRTAVIRLDEKAPEAKPVLEIRPISELETLKLERAAATPIIPEIEKADTAKIREASVPVIEQEKKLEKKIEVEEQKVQAAEKAEKVENLIRRQSATIEEIKEAFDRVDEIDLYSGKVLRGAIIERGKQYSILTTLGTVRVPESQVRSVRVIR